MQIGTIRNSNAKRQLLFRPKKKILSQCFLQIYRNLLIILLAKRFQKCEIFWLQITVLFIFFSSFQTSTPSNALNLNLPRSVQQLTHHDQMEFYTHGVILFML